MDATKIDIGTALKNIITTPTKQVTKHVLHTGVHLQVAVEVLRPWASIPMEAHIGEQYILWMGGSACVTCGKGNENKNIKLEHHGESVVMSVGVWHEIIAGEKGFSFMTVYAPPEH